MHGENRSGFFEKSRITMLQDSVVTIGNGILLAGRSDGRIGNRKTIPELLKDTSPALPLILLDHRPTELDAASDNNVDLQLSGHTHNGQLFPVNLIYPIQYELTWGYLQKRRTHFIVTSGVQVWGPPVRTAGDSEIVAIDLILNE
jgi:predicted MPP superfamily phosphohydrolase